MNNSFSIKDLEKELCLTYGFEKMTIHRRKGSTLVDVHITFSNANMAMLNFKKDNLKHLELSSRLTCAGNFCVPLQQLVETEYGIRDNEMWLLGILEVIKIFIDKVFES